MVKSRRSRVKFPALKPQYNLKSRYELIADCDYLHKLSEEEKAWLNAFNEEEINANFNHSGPKLNKASKDKRRCYNSNNARNRDILTRAKASGRSVSFGDLKEEEVSVSLEDKLIYQVDKKKKKKN
jgi:hypothetical protein